MTTSKVRPAPSGPAQPAAEAPRAMPDAVPTLKPGAGELQDRDLEKVSGGVRISKAELIKLQK